VVVTDLLLLSSIVVSGVIISIITDAKNARRYHRGGLVVVAARRYVLLLSSLFQQFQLSAQARRLGEPMEKLTHWDDAISTRGPLFYTLFTLASFATRLDSSFSGREKQKEVRFMYRQTRRLGFISRRVVLRARKESLSLSLSLSP
jgi:hypothetical protein